MQPEHKTRIVNAWRPKGKITAMTGDGVNDAPSIKSADIGIGMGITGTDVTKNVADMVLTDDNFATIVNAVEEGRRIYDNIRKAIQFLLGSNLAEVLAIFTATLLGFTILEAPHLLFINLVTDCFPALALGLEKAESDIMRRRPRDPSDGIFAGGLGFDVLYQGLLVTALTLAAFFIGERFETGHWAFMNIAQCEQGMTMAFLTMSMCEIFHSFNMRSQRGSVIKMSLRGSHNMPLFGAIMTALFARERTGKGDYVSASLYGTGNWVTSAINSGTQYFNPWPRSRFTQSPMGQAFETKDGKFVQIFVNEYERYFPVFCKAFNIEDMLDDERVNTRPALNVNGNCAIIVARCIEEAKKKTADEIMSVLQAGNVPCTVLRGIGDKYKEQEQLDQCLSNGYLGEGTYESGKHYYQPQIPIYMESVGVQNYFAQSKSIGADNDALFAEFSK